MPKVTFLPMGTVCEAQEGESLLEVAINHDVPLQHACGGFCSCTTCHVYIKSGADVLSKMDEMERERLDMSADGLTAESRLGCQAKVTKGDVTAHIVNPEY